MKILQTIEAARSYVAEARFKSQSIGFVPTMGALHDGHLSLVKASKQTNDLTVVSVFVNPTQFGPDEDFAKYPRDFEGDRQILELAGVDAIFYPTVQLMYPRASELHFEFAGLDKILCGLKRPGHFQGVALIVAKLFNIIKPQRAYFGQKDYQQTVVVKRLVEDLNFEVEIVVCATVRENDGLAMSSRNIFLSKDERMQAVFLREALLLGENLFRQHSSLELVCKAIQDVLSKLSLARIDYIEVRDAVDLSPVLDIDYRPSVILVAVFFGKTRLIDNILIST